MNDPKMLIDHCKYQEAGQALMKSIGEHQLELRKLMSMLHICCQGIGDKDRWKYYCHRPCAPERKNIIKKIFGLKEWRGDTTFDNILIPAEEGIGDELIYTVYLHLLEKRANIIYVECDPRLKPLFERTYNSHKFVFFERGTDDLQKHAKKCQYFILSSDLTYRLNPDFIPKLTKSLKSNNQCGYDGNLPIIIPKKFLTKKINNKRIGISYITFGDNAKTRMPPFTFWENIFNTYPVPYLNLQETNKTPTDKRGFLYPDGDLYEVDCDFRNDIDLLASIISDLDLVITISNSVAHLAGRLHKKCLLITPMNCNTRWLMTDVKNFYPKMTHIRGDWDYVQKRVIEELRKL